MRVWVATQTPLIVAAQLGHYDIVAHLLSAEGLAALSIDFRDGDGWTALHWAGMLFKTRSRAQRIAC